MNSVDDKIAYIDKVLGFYFDDEPFFETAKLFPNPGSEVDSWFKFAQVFDKVSVLGRVSEDHREILQLLVEDAATELKASAMLGEVPDEEQPLGDGYEDDYDFPPGFVERHQKLIWKVVKEVYGA